MSGPIGGDVAGVSRLKPLTGRRPSVISVLDIGSSKIACLIARLAPAEGRALGGRTHTIEVVGYGCTRSRGIKSGFVIDLDEAERAIRLAVDAAERMAEMTVGSLIVSTTCGRFSSDSFTAQLDIGHRAVTLSDIHKVLGAGGIESARDGRVVVHALPTGYRLDGQSGIADPEGMVGSELGLDLHVLSADEAPLRNLELALNRCHLEMETVAAAPYASALSTMVDDEAELGIACVDIGGGTTSLAIFQGGTFAHGNVTPVGGHHITLDIARGLSTGLSNAERLKVRHGSALPTPSDDHDFIAVPEIGEDDGGGEAGQTVARSVLNRIVKPRAEEILEIAGDMVKASGFAGGVGGRIIITGGGSQLTGLTEVARRMFGKRVRSGRPLGIHGMPDTARGAAFSALAGLAIYPQVAAIEQFQARSPARFKLTGTDGYAARFGRWFRESF